MWQTLKQFLSRPQHTLTWTILTVTLLYLFAAILQLSNVALALSDALPPELSLQLLLYLPVDLVANSSVLVGLLYLMNVTLMSLFFILFWHARSVSGIKQNRSGLFGSLGSIFGVGCAACGSILTPFIAGLGVFLPLSVFLYVNEVLSFLSTLLISYSIYSLLKRLHNPYQNLS